MEITRVQYTGVNTQISYYTETRVAVLLPLGSPASRDSKQKGTLHTAFSQQTLTVSVGTKQLSTGSGNSLGPFHQPNFLRKFSLASPGNCDRCTPLLKTSYLTQPAQEHQLLGRQQPTPVSSPGCWWDPCRTRHSRSAVSR